MVGQSAQPLVIVRNVPSCRRSCNSTAVADGDLYACQTRHHSLELAKGETAHQPRRHHSSDLVRDHNCLTKSAVRGL